MFVWCPGLKGKLTQLHSKDDYSPDLGLLDNIVLVCNRLRQGFLWRYTPVRRISAPFFQVKKNLLIMYYY